jgi:hypothetical protein
MLQSALPSLQFASASLTTPDSSLSALAQQFLQRAQLHNNSALGPIGRDNVCAWLAKVLGSPVRKESVEILIHGQIAELQKFAAIVGQPPPTTAQPTASSGAHGSN